MSEFTDYDEVITDYDTGIIVRRLVRLEDKVDKLLEQQRLEDEDLSNLL